jgi:hypothetical protein
MGVPNNLLLKRFAVFTGYGSEASDAAYAGSLDTSHENG